MQTPAFAHFRGHARIWQILAHHKSALKCESMRLKEVHVLKEPQVPPAGATILIADDSAEWRAQVHEILAGLPECQIIGEACDGLEAIQKTLDLHPDLVLLDIGMPVMNGIQAATKICNAASVPKVVFLTQDNDPEVMSTALTIGADGYVLKAYAATELVSAIATALSNGHRRNQAGSGFPEI